MIFNLPPSFQFLNKMLDTYTREQKSWDKYSNEWFIYQQVITDIRGVLTEILPERFRDEV